MSDSPSPDPGQLKADQERIVDVLGQEWSALDALLSGLPGEAWSATVLPGWDVHDVLAHMVGTECSLAGIALPEGAGGADADAPHVHNDIGKLNELWVLAKKPLSHGELLAEFRELTGQRLAALAAMPADQFHAPSWTPAGPGTYGRFMEIRIFDCWMHEQDIRAATGRPGNESGAAAERSLAEVVGALGYIIGKKGRAPDGSSVLIRLTGPMARDLFVVTDGRAKVVESLPGEPTALIELSSSLFLRLAGGRVDPDAVLDQVRLGGDQALARRLAANLAFTI